MKSWVACFILLLSFIVFNLREANSMEQWSEENKKNLTTILQQYMPEWNENKTEKMLRDSESSGEYSSVFMTNKGKLAIKIMGNTILVNGKDITGNLGSEITHGNFSPIIKNVNDSSIAIGNNNVINANYQVLYNSLVDLDKIVSTDERIPDNEKIIVDADIKTIQSQLQKDKPSTNILKEAWGGIKKVLDTYGYVKQIIEIGKLILPLFGI